MRKMFLKLILSKDFVIINRIKPAKTPPIMAIIKKSYIKSGLMIYLVFLLIMNQKL